MAELIEFELIKGSITNLCFDNYEKNFTFVVNGKEFRTNRIFADLLSTKINELHLIDQTNNIFYINTKNSGDFTYFLNLKDFIPKKIPETELPFILEVITILDSKFIKFSFETQEDQPNLTISSVFKNISKHESYESVYSKQLDNDIKFISTHFFEIEDEKIPQLKLSTIERIFDHTDLVLNSEDQILNIVNEYYQNDPSYSILYKYVNFINVSSEAIQKFLTVFDINDMTNEVWNQISKRLEKDINASNEPLLDEKRYKKVKKEIQLLYEKNKEFNGILNYIRKNSNNNEIKITASSINYGKPEDLICYENNYNFFYTKAEENSWICFEFKNHQIIPTNYTIRSVPDQNNYHPRTWVIEVSNDNKNWEIIDKQENCNYLNGKSLVHTFEISKEKQKEIKYLRMKETGPTWCGGICRIEINAFEIYGFYI